MGFLGVLGIIAIVVGALGLLSLIPLSLPLSILVIVGGLLLVFFGSGASARFR